VYILLSQKDNRLYIGYTTNLKRRIKEHQQGKNISTAKRLPIKLLYYEAHCSKEDATRREHYFKTDKGKSTIKLMLRDSLEILKKDFQAGRIKCSTANPKRQRRIAQDTRPRSQLALNIPKYGQQRHNY